MTNITSQTTCTKKGNPTLACSRALDTQRENSGPVVRRVDSAIDRIAIFKLSKIVLLLV